MLAAVAAVKTPANQQAARAVVAQAVIQHQQRQSQAQPTPAAVAVAAQMGEAGRRAVPVS